MENTMLKDTNKILNIINKFILYCFIYLFGFNFAQLIFLITNNIIIFYIIQGLFMALCSYLIGMIIYNNVNDLVYYIREKKWQRK